MIQMTSQEDNHLMMVMKIEIWSWIFRQRGREQLQFPHILRSTLLTHEEEIRVGFPGF